MLNITNLNKQFGGLHAISGLSLTIERNQLHAIIGPNGAGKTTLLAQIAGEIKPDSGTITLDGIDISSNSVAARARLGIGRTFQLTCVMLPLTCLQNVMLAVQGCAGHAFSFWRAATDDSNAYRQALAALTSVGLAQRTDDLAGHLSHGEHRQLELAMALAMKPVLLLLDEPMAGMAQEETTAITKLLKQIKGKLTIVLVEHDMDVVFELADRLSVLHNGSLLASGAVTEVRNNAAVQQAYLGHGHA